MEDRRRRREIDLSESDTDKEDDWSSDARWCADEFWYETRYGYIWSALERAFASEGRSSFKRQTHIIDSIRLISIRFRLNSLSFYFVPIEKLTPLFICPPSLSLPFYPPFLLALPSHLQHLITKKSLHLRPLNSPRWYLLFVIYAAVLFPPRLGSHPELDQ